MTKKRQKNRKNAFLGDFSIFKFVVNTFTAAWFSEIQYFLTETCTSLNCHNFRYIEAIDLNLFLKDCKFNLDVKNAIKAWQKFNRSRVIRD